jgi:hypothetical protein
MGQLAPLALPGYMGGPPGIAWSDREAELGAGKSVPCSSRAAQLVPQLLHMCGMS